MPWCCPESPSARAPSSEPVQWSRGALRILLLLPAYPRGSFAGERDTNNEMNKRSTVLVTGGAGFIGSELVRQLAARGERVLIVDNLVNGTRENVEEALSDRVQLLVLDVRALDRLQSHLRSVRVVYHLACLGVRHS